MAQPSNESSRSTVKDPDDGQYVQSSNAPQQVVDMPAGGAEEFHKRRARPITSRRWWQGFFDSHTYHRLVIVLVLVDLAAIVVDLSITLAHCPEPKLHEPLEQLLEALTWMSVGILCIFVVEFAGQLVCFGLPWCRSFTHLLDVTVVVASLVLELVLRSSDLKDVVALLIVFRLWRLVRVVHATEEILHIEHGQKSHALKLQLDGARHQIEELQQEVAALRGRLVEAEVGIAQEQQEQERERS